MNELAKRIVKESQAINVTISLDDLKVFAKEVAIATVESLNETKEPETVWLTPEQVAERLNKTLSTLWRWEKEGYLKPFRFGRKCRYRESDVVKVEQAEKGGTK